MSSSDFDYGNDSDNEWSSNNEDVDDEAILIENTFYEADDIKKNDPEQALEGFLKVLELEKDHPDTENQWRFKSLKNIVLLECTLGRYQEMYEHISALSELMDSVARNDATEAINTIMDASSKITDSDYSMKILHLIIDKLKASSNSRLVFNTQSKLAKIYLEKRELHAAENVINEMLASCKLPDGSEDLSKAQSLIEAYAYEIQLCSLTKNTQRMKEVSRKTEMLKVDISDPRILGVIKESISQMYMSKKDWGKALSEQFEAFKSYQEVGNPRAKTMLKYLVLTSLLSGSDINPFHSQEAKVYKDDPEILNLMNLRLAYESNDINTVQRLLDDKSLNIKEDTYMGEFVEDLYRTTRLAALKVKISPYKIVKIKFLAEQLRITYDQTLSLLVQLIIEGSIAAQIDDVDEVVEVASGNLGTSKREQASKKWVRSLISIQSGIMDRSRA